MIYAPNDKALLRYYTGQARVNLACRIVHAKYANHLGPRGRAAVNACTKKSYEYFRFIDMIRTELIGYGVPFEITTQFLEAAGWT